MRFKTILSDLQIQRMKQWELVCCSHLLDFCTRHCVIHDKSEFISDTSRLILSYHLVPPLTTHRYFGLGLRSGGGGRVTKFCTRHYSNTHTIGKDREVVGARRLTDPHSECLDDSQHRAPFSRCAILKCGREIHDYAVLQPGTTIFPRMLAQKLERFWRHYSSAQFKFRP